MVFDGIYKKLEYDLHKKKKEMAAIIEDSKNAQRRADRSQRSLDKLKQGMEDEKKHLKKNGPTSARSWSRTASCKRRCGGRSARSTSARPQKRWRPPKGPTRSRLSEDPEESEEEEEESPGKKKVEEDRPKLTEEEVANIKRPLKGLRRLEELVDTASRLSKNSWTRSRTSSRTRRRLDFSLFNSINELNSDIEADGIGDRRDEARDGEVQGPRRVYGHAAEARAQELEEKLEKTTAAADAYERKHQAASKIGQLKTGIHSIFSRLGGTSAAVEEIARQPGRHRIQYVAVPEDHRAADHRNPRAVRRHAARLHAAPAGYLRDRCRHAPRQQDCGGAAGLRRHGRGRRGGR